MFALGQRAIFIALIFSALFVLISAECPNACSSHGKCGAYDACQCYRNWMANDCSERICQFGLAHVDTPKGDLDASSGALYSPRDPATGSPAPPIIVGDAMYPKGTFEKFPQMVDTKGLVLEHTAHEYVECSNKGICDRASGTCSCFDGYDGSSCQRASCPSTGGGVCSGHGTCATVKDIAKNDYNNSYNLWDEFSTMGCVCDHGYTGPDCAITQCKVGFDPLYYDDEVNTRYSNFTFALWNIDYSDTKPNHLTKIEKWAGNYSIVFYDSFDKGWRTGPIDIRANCDDITYALERLPNNVIKMGSVLCSFDYGVIGTYYDDATNNPTEGYINNAATSVFPKGYAPDGFPIKLDANNPATAPVYVAATGSSAGTIGPSVIAKFTLAFPSNPGKLKQPRIDLYLDGSRPTVTTGSDTSISNLSTFGKATFNEVNTWVYPNGFTGENVDFVPDLCENVLVNIIANPVANSVWSILSGMDSDEIIRLKKCLGDADGGKTDAQKNDNNNLNKASDTQDALYNWDYGIEVTPVFSSTTFSYSADKLLNPHLIKLVGTSTNTISRLCNTTSYCRNDNIPGFYAVLYYDPTASGATNPTFQLLSKPHLDYDASTTFYVFTTTGFLQLAASKTDVFTHYKGGSGSGTTATGDLVASDVATGATVASVAKVKADLKNMYSNVVYTSWRSSTAGSPNVNDGSPNVDCETASSDVFQCIEKGDYVMIFDTVDKKTIENPLVTSTINGYTGSKNPLYPNIYQVMKISRENREAVPQVYPNVPSGSADVFRYQIVLDMSMNAKYDKIGVVTPSGVTTSFTNYARIYKFTPPANPITYVGPCSQRGICDGTTGVCGCFAGYTGDDCSVMNALAQ